MKPSFALIFSHEGIGLLHRGRGGWVSVGEVSLDDPDIHDRLTWLRKTAAGLAQGAVTTKLVIPNSEILYDEIDLGPGSPKTRDSALRRALDGRTPYSVDELAFDYVLEGDVARVAVAARETLTEAETFATEHRFNPVCFVAIPPHEAFDGEPLFGTTQAALTLLDPDDPLERDDGPIEIVGQAKLPELDDDKPVVGVDEDDDETTDETAPETTGTAPGDGQAHTLDVPETDDPAEGHGEDSPDPAPDSDEAAVASLFATRRRELEADLDDSFAAPLIAQRQSRIGFGFTAREVEQDETVPADAETEDPVPRVSAVAEAPAPDLAPAIPKPLPKSPPPRSRVSAGLVFSVLLLVALVVGALLYALVGMSIEEDATFTEPIDPVPQVVSAPVGETAPPPVARLSLPEVNDEPAPEELADTEPETEPDAPPFMTLVEAETEYAKTGIWQRRPDPLPQPIIKGLEDLYLASLDPEIAISDAVALPGYLPGRDQRPITPRPPVSPGRAFDLGDDGLVALTPEGALSPEGVRVQQAGDSLRPPPRPETDPPEPTAEETATALALSQFRPRPRPELLGETVERTELGGYTRAELAARRPRARPLSEQAIASAAVIAAGASTAAVIDVPGEAEPIEGATALAVASSRTPLTRPNNIAEIVAAARAAAPRETQAVAPARTTTQPSIPTRASVARQATIENAISLRRVNLIGVYGKPSDRRALVRLANGRYVKVEVGDRVDGGQVAAIGDSSLQYIKRGRNVTLRLPSEG